MTEDIYMIGNAHLDPAWMWRLEEGFEAFLATCRSALQRIEETPGFIFTASSASHYEFVELTDPALFRQIQEQVKLGRWSVVGGWWTESDCNIPSGEAFIRQGLYGQKFFESRFGIKSKSGFCIDSFGHNANLPQLLRHCGMNNYVFMRPEQDEKKLDSSLFRWAASGDAEVMAYRIPLHYSNYRNTIQEKLKLLREYSLYRPSLPWMVFYGVGNHGGGPTRAQISQIIEQQRSNKDFRISFSSVDDFFECISRRGIELPVVEGEFQPHAIGCYSAHSEIKRLNRQVENSLLRSEKLSMLAELSIPHFNAKWGEYDGAWKNLLLNNFHDILGGVSIIEACNDAIDLYSEALAISARKERIAVQVLCNALDTHDSVESLIVINPQAWDIMQPIEFELWHPEASEKNDKLSGVSLKGENGKSIPSQKIESSGKIGEDRVRFTSQVSVRSFGWTKLVVNRETVMPVERSSIKATENILSNGLCGIAFDGGVDENLIPYTPAQVFMDESDTWGHGITGFNTSKGLFKIQRISVLEKGPVRGRVRVESAYGNSRMEEDFILYSEENIIEQRIYLDWRKPNAVLKLRYPHQCKYPKTFFEIPYGFIERPISKNEVPGGAWAFVQDDSKGLGIINNAKSSYSSDENFLYLTCARSPLFAHHAPPHISSTTESKRYLDQGEQEFSIRLITGCKTWQDANMARRTTEFLQPVVVHVETAHNGDLESKSHTISVTPSNILVSAIKRSYSDSDSSTIFRVVETAGIGCEATLDVPELNVSWKSRFRPMELKSFRIRDGKVLEVNGLEEQLITPI
ncbi:MAG: glycoside hydrolase family 38 C-terminal domain-containing protein [Bacteroidota bacterium]|nr:glycoside hydrolase family 38 C-terminal domain-containing protein [Bacteroidota bacterium]MDP4235452.1 glycoside hydrolase family 38 C-terminal domain-containing protein [Bacteroidota bacterium]